MKVNHLIKKSDLLKLLLTHTTELIVNLAALGTALKVKVSEKLLNSIKLLVN